MMQPQIYGCLLTLQVPSKRRATSTAVLPLQPKMSAKRLKKGELKMLDEKLGSCYDVGSSQLSGKPLELGLRLKFAAQLPSCRTGLQANAGD